MADTGWNDEEILLEDHLRIYARKSQDRFAHLISSTVKKFKHAAEGTKIGDTTVSAGFSCRNHTRASAAPLSTCPKTCPFCVKQFRPLSWQETTPILRYKSQHSDGEAANIIRDLARQTRNNLLHIRQTIRTSGNMLAKRWQKKSPVKRAVLLAAAMPQMRRRVGLLKIRDLRDKELSTLKPQLSLPYLSIEILSEDSMSLLALLHHRSIARISDWVMFDGMQIKSSFGQGALEACYNPHCVSMYGEDDDVGNLVFWNMDEAHRSRIIGYPLAKLILEAQSIMSTFLVEMVNSILHIPVESAAQGHDNWDSLYTSNFVKNGADHTAPLPRRPGYRAAPTDHLRMLRCALGSIKARHAANKSDTRLLQTDPAYTRQTLISLEQYGQSYNDNQRRDSMTPLILSSVSRQVSWCVLEETAKGVLQDIETESASGTFDAGMRSRCAAGLQVLERALQLEFVSVLVRTRIRLQQTGPPGHILDPRNKHRSCLAKGPKAGDNLALWALNHMNAHDQHDHPIPEHYLALLEYDIASQKRDESFHQTLYDYVADLSVLDEAIMAIKYVRPDYCGMENGDTETYIAEMPNLKDLNYADYVECNVCKHREVLWPPLKTLLSAQLPTGKANRASLAAFDASHAALDAFWEVARKIRRELLVKSGCPPERVEVLMVAINASLSPDYMSEVEQERAMLVGEIDRIGINEICLYQGLANLTSEKAADKRRPHQREAAFHKISPHTHHNDRNARGSTPLQTRSNSISSPQSYGKVKVKTRPNVPVQGFTDETDTANAGAPVVDLDNTTADRISVCPTSMDIFKRMFVSYGKHTNSNLRWSEFVKAMDDAGFPATWSTGGSAVVFDDSRGGGAIRLHQPHPDPSINPIMLRSFGKRMFRQFGWSIDTFVESA